MPRIVQGTMGAAPESQAPHALAGGVTGAGGGGVDVGGAEGGSQTSPVPSPSLSLWLGSKLFGQLSHALADRRSGSVVSSDPICSPTSEGLPVTSFSDCECVESRECLRGGHQRGVSASRAWQRTTQRRQAPARLGSPRFPVGETHLWQAMCKRRAETCPGEWVGIGSGGTTERRSSISPGAPAPLRRVP